MRHQRLLVATLLGAAACYAALAITDPPGPGLDPDSMSYLGAAESLARGRGLRIPAAGWADADSTTPLVHFPPGFSVLIAGPVALGADPVQAARAIIAVAALVTVGLATWLASSVSGVGAGVVAGVALLVSPSYAFDHWQVVSEPVCLALLMATLGLMADGRRPLLYGLTAALAGAVRYAALSAIGAAVLWALGRGGAPRERLRRAALAAVPAVLLQGLWVLRTALESGLPHRLQWQGGMGTGIRELGGTLVAWLAPAVPAGAPALLMAIAVVAGGCWVVGRTMRAAPAGASGSPPAPARRFLAAAALLASCYAAEVLVSRLLVYENIPFDPRLLSPFILLVEVAMAAALGAAWRTWRPRARAAAGAAAVIWLALSAWATVGAVGDALDGGWGYSSDDWRGSHLAEWLRTDGSRAPLFSNNPAAVYLLIHRPSREVPADLDPDSVREFGLVLERGGGLLIRFPYDYEPVARPDSLARRLGLPLLARFDEGVVWGPPRPGAP